MNTLLKIAGVAALAIGLAACADETATTQTATTAPAKTQVTVVKSHHGMNKAQRCASLKNQVRMIDRQAPGADAKVAALQAKIDKLNCGSK